MVMSEIYDKNVSGDNCAIGDKSTSEDISVEEILKENERRKEAERVPYDPVSGLGAVGERVTVAPREATAGQVEYVPRAMTADPEYPRLRSRCEWVKLRCRYDFEFWAAVCVKIKHKTTAAMVPFILNAPQRRVLGVLEGERLAGHPIRIIMLKARQWGGSTLVQMYMAWIQCTQVTNWHSLICAHVGKTSAIIRGMYDDMLANYPQDYWEGESAPRLNRYQGQELVREISDRRCRITLGSSERQDSIRGSDYAMAHLSEVAFWRDSAKSSPNDFIRAICGAIALAPLTLIVLESTANGVGNYFHSEWLRSERGESDKITVFVPWYEIEMYQCEVADPEALWHSLNDYELALWRRGITLERILWYRLKRREYPDQHQMMAEYPTTPQEAFSNTGTNVFDAEAVERMRLGCFPPIAVGEVASASGHIVGALALTALRFCPAANGDLSVWENPAEGETYVAAVDVGGRSLKSDWSVIAVMTVRRPRVVAQWRGHIDHDILTWKAAAIARFYNSALLVFESNTLESDGNYAVDAPDQGVYILHELYEHYPNLYYRQSPEGGAPRPGFHTNRATKQMIITTLVGAVRDGAYVERSSAACDEFTVYQRRENGSYGARIGYHDDILMTRAIAFHVVREQGPSLASSSLAADPDLASFLHR